MKLLERDLQLVPHLLPPNLAREPIGIVLEFPGDRVNDQLEHLVQRRHDQLRKQERNDHRRVGGGA